MLDSERTCYTCLNEDSKKLINAFDPDTDDITYWDKLKMIMNTELQQGDLSGLCESCINLLRATYKFITMVKASQETLYDLEEDEGYTFEPLVEITELDRTSVELSTNNRTNEHKNKTELNNKRTNVVEDEENCNNIPTSDSTNTVYKCEFCNKGFNYKSHLREHILTHSSVNLYKCGYCQRSFCGVAYRKRHHDMHRAKGHIGKGSEEINDCETPGEQVDCKFCEELSRTLTDARYKFVDRVKLQCEQCALEFKSNLQVTKHIARVHGEGVYNCDFCDRNFKRLYLLQLHMHKNHECNLFYRKAKETNLNKLEQKPSAENLYKPFICPVCGKGFPLRNTKKRHMRVHLGIKKYLCRVCMQRFSQSYQLKLHSRRHSGEKPYTCGHCSMSFLSNTSLRRHMLQHNDVEASTQEIESINVDCDVFIDNEDQGDENCSDSD